MHNEKNTAHKMPGGDDCARTQNCLAVHFLCPKTDAVILNVIATRLYVHIWCP